MSFDRTAMISRAKIQQRNCQKVRCDPWGNESSQKTLYFLLFMEKTHSEKFGLFSSFYQKTNSPSCLTFVTQNSCQKLSQNLLTVLVLFIAVKDHQNGGKIRLIQLDPRPVFLSAEIIQPDSRPGFFFCWNNSVGFKAIKNLTSICWIFTGSEKNLGKNL